MQEFQLLKQLAEIQPSIYQLSKRLELKLSINALQLDTLLKLNLLDVMRYLSMVLNVAGIQVRMIYLILFFYLVLQMSLKFLLLPLVAWQMQEV